MIHKDVTELNTYTSLDLSECGNYVDDLLNVAIHDEDHGMSVEFADALDEELKLQLNRYKTRTRIVTREVQPAVKVYKELEWLSE